MLFKLDKDPIELSNELSLKYKYRPLPSAISITARHLYESKLPQWCSSDNRNISLITLSNTVIAKGFNRIVTGDYGSFVEIEKSQMVREAICCKKGEEYRFRNPNFADNVKYFWYTAKDESNVKIYFQQKGVAYADYLPGKFYISPHELNIS